MLAYVPRTFTELFPPRTPQRRGLPLLFLDATGATDPTRGYGSSTHSLDAEMERIREETTRLTETGYLSDDARTRRLVWWLRRMGYDDALVWADWRVELLYIDTGQPHFRLYWKGYVFGVVGIATSHADLGMSRNLEVQRRLLAAYLVGWGWSLDDMRLIRDGALTPLKANVDHQYRLFECKTTRKSEAGYDLLRERNEE
jgi:hypothetical protein